MCTHRFILTIAATFFMAFNAYATPSIVGLWKTVDPDTGLAKSLVRITESNGEFNGKIDKLFLPAGNEQKPICKKCADANKDQPIVGMTILTGMKQDGDSYTGGHIFDPQDGDVYKSKIQLIEGGKKLKVRGYVGTPMLGETRIWLREE